MRLFIKGCPELVDHYNVSMEIKMNKSVKFWNLMALRYSRKSVEDEESYLKKLEITQSYFTPEMKVLEFGCGTGSTAIRHSEHLDKIMAIDFSEKMIEIARQKAKETRADNVVFETSSIEDFDIEENSMDVILGLSILHLVENKQQTVSNIYHALKANGLFISSTLCTGKMNFFLTALITLGNKIGVVPHVSFFTVSELRQCIIDSGFTIEKTFQPGKNKAVFFVARK